MFEVFLEFYVRVFSVLLPGLVLAVVVFHAKLAGFGVAQTVRITGFLVLFLALWFAIASLMGEAGLLMPPPTISDPPFVMIFLLGGGILLFALARFTSSGRAIFSATDQRYLIGLQALRVMGWVFLLGWFYGRIPWQFALPAGVGDIWAGLAAIGALRALNRNAPDAQAKVLRANIIGLIDFFLAVVIGIITSEGFAHILSKEAPNIINNYPLALFPAFFVPIFLGFHLLSLAKLREDKKTNKA